VSEAKDSGRAGPAPAEASAPEDPLEIPRLGFFQLVPKRNLVKIAMLLFVLAGIIFLQRRSATVVRQISDIVMPQPARPAESSRRARLAPPDPSRP
jgi:hypothetical protein